jgi:D-alanine-D-alanine ligase
MLNDKPKTIGLLIGGISTEREVSLKTGEAIYNALIKLGYKVEKIDPKYDNLYEKSQKTDIIFNALHGRYGEDGLIQGFLETIKKPYTGSPVVSSAITMSKVFTKQILAFHKIPIIEFKEINTLEDYKSIDFDFPMVVKPANEGSSVGITLVKNEKELKNDIKKGIEKYKNLLVEPYIKGKEIQVAVLNGKVLGSIEIIPKNEFYDYDAKYVSHDTKYITPAEISNEINEKLFKYSEKINKILKCN